MTSRGVRISDSRSPDESIVPVERDVLTGRPSPVRRDDKHRRDDTARELVQRRPPAVTVPSPRRPGWRGPWALAGAAAVAVVAIVLIATLVTRGGETGSAAAPQIPASSGEPQSSSSEVVPTAPSAASPPVAPSSVTAPAGTPAPVSTRSVASSIARSAPTAYLATLRVTAVEGDAETYGHPLGSTSVAGFPCRAGVCSGSPDYPVTLAFRAGAARVHQVVEVIDEPSATTTDLPCFHVTATLDLTRQPDGSYTGTYRFHPRAVEYSVKTANGSEGCSAGGWTESVVAVPR